MFRMFLSLALVDQRWPKEIISLGKHLVNLVQSDPTLKESIFIKVLLYITQKVARGAMV